jgi:hypothetical protein
MSRATILLCITIVAAFPVQAAPADSVSEDVPVPGGIASAARSLGLPSVPDRPRFVAEVARLTHPAADTSSGEDLVPIPLSASLWSRAVLHRQVPPAEIVPAILSDSRAAHLCYGLAGADDETLRFYADHPDLLRHLYERSAALFAAFGARVRVREGRIAPPGGPDAIPIWEAAVGEKVVRPEPFVRALFARGEGRLAYLYDAIAALDPPRAAFALGLWMKDPAARIKRFGLLVEAAGTAFPQWQPARLPFSRALNDIASLLARVQVEPDGAPRFPAQRSLWAWVFERSDTGSDPPGLTRTTADDEVADAAWFAKAIELLETRERGDRLDQLAFAQRVFASLPRDDDPDLLWAVRVFPRYRMLMLELERMGVRSGPVFRAAALMAGHLSALDGHRAFVAITQFQGALALISRMATTGAIDVATAGRLITSLSKLPDATDSRDAGAIAAWLRQDLRQALSASGELEHSVQAAVSGRGPARRGSSPAAAGVISWEGQNYRLDLTAAEEQRLSRIRERQGGPSLDIAVDLSETARLLASGSLKIGDVTTVAEALKRIALEAAGSNMRRQHEAIEHAVEDLGRIHAPHDLERAAHVGRALAEIGDDLLAEALMAWTYALSTPEADSPVLNASVTSRHDFGLGPAARIGRARLEWAMPRPEITPGVPWHVVGSLLGLDVAMSSVALRRVNAERVIEAPTMSMNERASFAEAVALLNPFALHDGDRDAIAAAIGAGRQRVASIGEDAGAADQLASEIRMDGWRRRALHWTMAHEPERVGSLFSMTELLYLGRGPVDTLDSWGMAATISSGCLCTRLAPPNELAHVLGRPQLGLLASTVADLNLHVAVMLRELELPAAIAKAVLAAAMQDFIDEARPTDANDWLTLVRAAQAVPRDRIEDYVAAVTANGPLVPAQTAAPSQ